jgi:hypothetical protein
VISTPYGAACRSANGDDPIGVSVPPAASANAETVPERRAGVVRVGHEQLTWVGRPELAAERAQALGRDGRFRGHPQAAAGADGEAVDPTRPRRGPGAASHRAGSAAPRPGCFRHRRRSGTGHPAGPAGTPAGQYRHHDPPPVLTSRQPGSLRGSTGPCRRRLQSLTGLGPARLARYVQPAPADGVNLSLRQRRWGWVTAGTAEVVP